MREIPLRSKLSILCFAAPVLVFAQAGASASKTPPPGVIQSVEVVGARLYSIPEIKRVLALNVGGPVSTDTLRDAQKRLLNTDLFSNVEYGFHYSLSKPPQYDITFKISEFEQVYPLHFEDLGVPDGAIKAYLRERVTLYSDQIPPTEPVLRRYTQASQEFISRTNPQLKVKASVASDNPDHPQVIIAPNRPEPRIAGVTITGNKAVETPVLMRAINEVAFGERLSDQALQLLLQKTVMPLYAAKGYVAVTFPKIDVEKSKENEGYIVHLTIQEGPVFHFGNSAFRGGQFTPEEIRGLMHYQKGDVFDLTKAEQLRTEIAKSLRRSGHLDTQVVLSQEEDDKNSAVNLAYSITPGPVYTFQTLDIHGLDIEGEPTVRKLWAPKPGTPFDPYYPEYFLGRVRGLGLFDNLGSTKSTFTPNESSHTVVVDLFFGGAQGEKQKAVEKGIPEAPTDGSGAPTPQ